MSAFPSQTKLFDACSVLFGPEVKVSIDFVRYLRPSGVKAAYRKRARETHPDLAKVLGLDETIMNERFKEVTLAYEVLNSVVREDGADLPQYQHEIWRPGTASRKPPPKKPKKPKKPDNTEFSNRKESEDHFYQGYIPKRELRIGQYMYYSGIISWRMLIDSVIWQRKNRPLIGEIARDWRILSVEDIHEILLDRKFGEKFGECAIRKSYLSPFNLLALLGKQRKLQQPIGEYFVANDILCSEEIDLIVEKLKSHNRKSLWRRW